MYQNWHNRYDPPCFFLTFDILRCQITQSYNSSLKTEKIFLLCKWNDRGSEVRRDSQKITQGKILDQRTQNMSWHPLLHYFHLCYMQCTVCKTQYSLAASCPGRARLLFWLLCWLHGFSGFPQVPRTSELYVHRSGRTARAAHEGLSLLLIGPEDLINFRKIYKTLEKSEELPIFPVDAKCMTSIKVKK